MSPFPDSGGSDLLQTEVTQTSTWFSAWVMKLSCPLCSLCSVRLTRQDLVTMITGLDHIPFSTPPASLLLLLLFL